jgi:hypothetical protein
MLAERQNAARPPSGPAPALQRVMDSLETGSPADSVSWFLNPWFAGMPLLL